MTPEQQRALALARARRRRAEAEQQSQTAKQIDDYYSSGIYAGDYNPLGAIARTIDAATTAGGDAMTFGWGDEAVGLVSDDAQQAARERQKTLRETNPVASTVGAVGGGLATGVALSPISATAQLTTRATPLLGRAAAGAADGAVAGGLYGAGSGDSASGRLTEGLKAAGFGAAVGFGLPVLSDAVGASVRGARNWWNAAPIAKEVGADPDALRLLRSTMDADGSLGPTGQAAMARAGDEAMLVDAGPNARQLLDYTIQRGGPGTVKATNAVADRVSRESKLFGQILDRSLGKPQGIGTAQNTIRDATAPDVSRAYKQAYNTPIDYASPAGRKVEDIIKRIPSRVAKSAIEKANERIVYEGWGRQIMADIADDGTVVFREMPSVMQADQIKRALDGIANDSINPQTFRKTDEGAFFSKVARDLRDAVGEAVPAYRVALQTAADPLSQQSAVRLGADLSKMTRDEFGMAIKGMTRPEKQGILQGFRSRIDDQMAAVQRAITDGDMDAREALKGLKELSSRRVQENLRAVMPKDQADGLFNTIDKITATFELRASTAQNSKTATRLAAERMVDEKTAPGVIGRAARGEPLGAGKAAIQKMTGYTDDYLRGLQDETYSNLAELLTRRGGPGQDVYDAIGRLDQTDQATQLMTNRLAELLSAPKLAYPMGSLLGDAISGR